MQSEFVWCREVFRTVARVTWLRRVTWRGFSNRRFVQQKTKRFSCFRCRSRCQIPAVCPSVTARAFEEYPTGLHPHVISVFPPKAREVLPHSEPTTARNELARGLVHAPPRIRTPGADFHFGRPDRHRYTPRSAECGTVFPSPHASSSGDRQLSPHRRGVDWSPRFRGISSRGPRDGAAARAASPRESPPAWLTAPWGCSSRTR
jgi:hypothetical protein